MCGSPVVPWGIDELSSIVCWCSFQAGLENRFLSLRQQLLLACRPSHQWAEGVCVFACVCMHKQQEVDLATMLVSALPRLAGCHPLFVILPKVCVRLQARKGDRRGLCVSWKGACSSYRLLLWIGVIKAWYQFSKTTPTCWCRHTTHRASSHYSSIWLWQAYTVYTDLGLTRLLLVSAS